jgi:hypothetical protein
MVTVESLLLGFSAAIISYVGTKLLVFGTISEPTATARHCVAFPGFVITEPSNGISVALLGLVISIVASYVALLYGGYSNRNWAKAAAIANEQANIYPKWNELLPKNLKLVAQQKTSYFCRWARESGQPCEPTTQLPPIFCVYTWLGISATLFHLIVLFGSATCLLKFWWTVTAGVLATALLLILLLLIKARTDRRDS